MQHLCLHVAWNSRSRSALSGWDTVSDTRTSCAESLLQPDLLRPVRSHDYWLPGAQLLLQLNNRPAVHYPRCAVQVLD